MDRLAAGFFPVLLMVSGIAQSQAQSQQLPNQPLSESVRRLALERMSQQPSPAEQALAERRAAQTKRALFIEKWNVFVDVSNAYIREWTEHGTANRRLKKKRDALYREVTALE
jgi:hypothetical protein